MEDRLLAHGTETPYANVRAAMNEGEILVAAWLRDPLMEFNERPVADEADYNSIVAKTKAGYYVHPLFSARAQ